MSGSRAVLSTRALGRAMLERQLLLRRAELPVVTAVERLFGLNAQDPNPPYVALWTRLEGFTMPGLTKEIENGSLVRSTLMRATQHVMAADDFRLVRPALDGLLRRVQRNVFGRRTEGVDLDALVAEARRLLADGRVLTRPELGRRLAERWPVEEPSALGWTVQYLQPVTHPAPSGTWNVRGATPFVLAEVPKPSAEGLREMVRRYLAAFGPASAADARAWSGVSGLREVFAELRPELRVFEHESGRELFDVPDAPIPDADAPAPVRFLPEFDAPLLAYADRTRVMTDEIRARVCVGDGVAATVLIDGTVAATWTISRDGATAVLRVRPFRALTPAEREAVEAEAATLLAFVQPEAGHRTEIRYQPDRD